MIDGVVRERLALRPSRTLIMQIPLTYKAEALDSIPAGYDSTDTYLLANSNNWLDFKMLWGQAARMGARNLEFMIQATVVHKHADTTTGDFFVICLENYLTKEQLPFGMIISKHDSTNQDQTTFFSQPFKGDNIYQIVLNVWANKAWGPGQTTFTVKNVTLSVYGVTG